MKCECECECVADSDRLSGSRFILCNCRVLCFPLYGWIQLQQVGGWSLLPTLAVTHAIGAEGTHWAVCSGPCGFASRTAYAVDSIASFSSLPGPPPMLSNSHLDFTQKSAGVLSFKKPSLSSLSLITLPYPCPKSWTSSQQIQLSCSCHTCAGRLCLIWTRWQRNTRLFLRILWETGFTNFSISVHLMDAFYVDT